MSAVISPPLKYYGGKFRMGDKIARLLPPHTIYVEPFGGAAGVLMRKSPAPIEVYNDIDGRIVNFFRVLRESPKELTRQLLFTPFSRHEYNQSHFASENSMEDARRVFIKFNQGFGSAGTGKITGWKMHRTDYEDFKRNPVSDFRRIARQLLQVAHRLTNVQIECDDALEIIARFDSPGTVFYLDPPYPSPTRSRRNQSAYSHEMGGMEHSLLADQLRRIEGAAIISTYENEGYEELFRGWRKLRTANRTQGRKIGAEIVYCSPRVFAFGHKPIPAGWELL